MTRLDERPKEPVDALLDKVNWKALPRPSHADLYDNSLPYATHTGTLTIGDVELECVVLNTGQRLFVGKVIEELVAAPREIKP